VAGHHEAVEAEGAHRLGLVLRQGTFRVGDLVWAGRRLRTVAVAAQIGDHQREFLGETRRDLAPQQMRLRIAVQ
jgi:hypothetical protein